MCWDTLLLLVVCDIQLFSKGFPVIRVGGVSAADFPVEDSFPRVACLRLLIPAERLTIEWMGGNISFWISKVPMWKCD